MSGSVDPILHLRRGVRNAPWVEWGLATAAQGVAAILAPPSAVLVPVPLVSLAVSVWASRRVLAGLDVDDGDLLLEMGPRVRTRPLFDQERVGRWLAGVWIAALGANVSLARDPIAMGILAGATVVIWLVVRQRRTSVALLRAHAAALEGRVDDARHHLAQLLVAASGDGVRQLLLAREGDGAEAQRAMEVAWSGALDQRAAVLATTRIARTGDADLARRWLAVARPAPTRFESYLEATLRAHVALVDGAPHDALAAVQSSPAVPPYFDRQLALLRVAALRASGRPADAEAARAALEPPLATEAWRRTAQRTFWSHLTGDQAPVVAPSLPAVPAPEHVFAAPVAAIEARAPSPLTGPVPFEGFAFVRRSTTLDVVRGVLALALLALAPMLAFTGLIASSDIERAQWLYSAGVSALVGGITAAPIWWVPRSRPAIVFEDGPVVPAGWVWLYAGQGVAQLAVVSVALAWALSGWVGAGFGALAIGVLLGRGIARARVWRIAADSVRADPRPLLRREVLWFGVHAAQVRAIRAISHLRLGDVLAAEAELRLAQLQGPDAGFVAVWLAAGRGEVVELATPGRGLGSRYRTAVARALQAAALRRDVAPHTLAEWDELAAALPNPFGDLLARLVEVHRRRAGTPPKPFPEGTDWVEVAWPGVAVDAPPLSPGGPSAP